MSLLNKLAGYRTKTAALVLAVLAANEVLHFLPDRYVAVIVYVAGALGLYGLREAINALQKKFEQGGGHGS